ncbi:hypothetical protein [Pedobacter duraquae]|uniref:Uncharacterized protein n=1 Tax=Pedobacter duraquae TaxID=425511 RepID=A0A4R6IL01_9SPHI|nr:hypothetical protein [Pedobacter duraquae]TDO22762.1 hypothetical protein CLV32_1747 [Pedobacter duraquae]
MKTKSKLKGVKPTKGKLLKEKEVVSIDAFQHPVFCFKYIHQDFDLNHCTADEKVALIEQIIRLSGMTWNDIKLAPKHGLGSEKITISAINAGLPEMLTEDVDHLLALRFLGKAPFVGWRNKFIFHIFYIDRGFTLYKH